MIAIISDIHGNYIALKEVFKVIDKMAISEIYCLGDVVGYYSQINECCEELRERKVSCVMGNHDWYMLSGASCPRSNSVNECLRYQRKIIKKDNLHWLSSFTTIIKINDISMVHGSWDNPIDDYLQPSKKYFDNISGRFFVSGHTHLQTLENYQHKKYCNPGSVGQPRDGNSKAAFATFDGKNFELHRVEYDIDLVGHLMEKAGFSGYYYGCLKTGAKNLQWANI